MSENPKTSHGVGDPRGLVKQLMTLDAVKATFPDHKWCAVQLVDGQGEVTETVAFRAPKLSDVKRLKQEADSLGDIQANLNLIYNCCLTHSPKQLADIIDDNIGFVKVAGEEIGKLIGTGVQALKKD